MASIVTTQGLGILWTYGKFMGEFYVGILILWVLIAFAGFLFLGARITRLINLIKEPIMLAFSTASSEAAYPKTLEQLERFGASKKITSFVLPLGYSFNLDGSMMYCTFAVLFIAQAYKIDLNIGQQITMLLILMVTSKGMAGAARVAGRHRGNTGDIQYPRGGAAFDHGHRPVSRHGPVGDQRGRQQHRNRSRCQVGGRASAGKRGAGGDRRGRGRDRGFTCLIFGAISAPRLRRA
jgi:hypothetical protein